MPELDDLDEAISARAVKLKRLVVLAKSQPPPTLSSPLKDICFWRPIPRPSSPSSSTKNASSLSNKDKKRSSSPTPPTLSQDYLLDRLEEFVVSAVPTPTLSPDELLKECLALLKSKKSADELQQPLLELLGFSDASFALISSMLSQRSSIVAQSHQSSKLSASNQPATGKPTKPAAKAPLLDIRAEFALSSNSSSTTAAAALPQGTTREWINLPHLLPSSAPTNMYEQVRVPPPLVVPSTEPLVQVEVMGSQSQKAFAGIPTLNRLQSHLFQTTYYSSENILVCAPTGAGKTNVAMLAICREIERCATPQQVKVIYVAPMKALAQEIVSKFAERLKPLRMVVRELTGDMQLTRAEIDSSQVIVTTPEKWDVITRKTNELTESIQLLIIDEVHLVGEDRGPVIECLVARTLRQVEHRQRMIRIVALSATLPNYADVAAFLRVNLKSGLFFFNSSYRPVPLEQTFCGVKLALADEQQVMNPMKKKALLEDLLTRVVRGVFVYFMCPRTHAHAYCSIIE